MLAFGLYICKLLPSLSHLEMEFGSVQLKCIIMFKWTHDSLIRHNYVSEFHDMKEGRVAA